MPESPQNPERSPEHQALIDRVMEWIRSDQLVCSFGKVALNQGSIDFQVVEHSTSAEDRAVIEHLHRQLVDFFKSDTHNTMVYVFPGDYETHEAARLRTLQHLVQLFVASQRFPRPPSGAPFNFHFLLTLEDVVRDEGRRDFTAQGPNSGLEETLAFAMSPVFDERHPRWSPELILVLNKKSVFQKKDAQFDRVRIEIVRRLIERMSALTSLTSDQIGSPDVYARVLDRPKAPPRPDSEQDPALSRLDAYRITFYPGETRPVPMP